MQCIYQLYALMDNEEYIFSFEYNQCLRNQTTVTQGRKKQGICSLMSAGIVLTNKISGVRNIASLGHHRARIRSCHSRVTGRRGRVVVRRCRPGYLRPNINWLRLAGVSRMLMF